MHPQRRELDRLAEQLQLDDVEPDVNRLVKLPAWERAKLYAAADLSLGERSLIELEVRNRIRADYLGDSRRRRRHKPSTNTKLAGPPSPARPKERR